MAIKKYKPTTPGRRNMTGYTFEEITKKGTGEITDSFSQINRWT
jgi:ribosomal protein L2